MRQRNPYRPPTPREQIHSIYEVMRMRAGWDETKISLQDVARRYLETQDIYFDGLSGGLPCGGSRAVRLAPDVAIVACVHAEIA